MRSPNLATQLNRVLMVSPTSPRALWTSLNTFLQQPVASVAGAKEINPVMLYGPKARGFGMECPRDKKMGSSYADALDAKHTGPASARCSKTSTTAQSKKACSRRTKPVASPSTGEKIAITKSRWSRASRVGSNRACGSMWIQCGSNIPNSHQQPRSCFHGPGNIVSGPWSPRWSAGVSVRR